MQADYEYAACSRAALSVFSSSIAIVNGPTPRGTGVMALVNGGDIFRTRNPDGDFHLLRIGDAVASRNIHAAVYDGIRFAMRL